MQFHSSAFQSFMQLHAKQLQTFYANYARINVKRTQAYELMARAVGFKNWNELSGLVKQDRLPLQELFGIAQILVANRFDLIKKSLEMNVKGYKLPKDFPTDKNFLHQEALSWDSIADTLAKRYKKTRETKGLLLEEAAKQLEISPKDLKDLESGACYIRPLTGFNWFLMAALYDTDVKDLMGLDEEILEPINTPEPTETAVGFFANAPEKMLEELVPPTARSFVAQVKKQKRNDPNFKSLKEVSLGKIKRAAGGFVEKVMENPEPGIVRARTIVTFD